MTNTMMIKRHCSPGVAPRSAGADIFRPFFEEPRPSRPRRPKVDVDERENSLILTAELPGFAAEDLEILVEENRLTLRALEEALPAEEGEAPSRKAAFERSFLLSQELRRDAVEAEMKNGLLTLTLPKKEKPAPQTIPVKG